MEPTSSALPLAPAPPGSRIGVWRFVKGAVVFLIVAFHLVLLAIRNPLDLWYAPIRDWMKERGHWEKYGEPFRLIDNVTNKYANLVGCEQGWKMFTAPLARGAPFLAIRIEFTDDSSELVLSEREPEPTAFFRVGDWQLRKHEDYLTSPPEKLASDPERPLWEACARCTLRKWRAAHPDDPRTPARVVLLRRRILFPPPDGDPFDYKPAAETEIASFDADGRLQP